MGTRKLRIALTIEIDENASYDRVSGVLKDALSEYRSAREPAKEYVDKRYPDTAEYGWMNRREKIASVELGNRFALALEIGELDVSDVTKVVAMKVTSAPECGAGTASRAIVERAEKLWKIEKLIVQMGDHEPSGSLFAKVVNDLLETIGMSDAEFAARFAMSAPAVRRWKSGATGPATFGMRRVAFVAMTKIAEEWILAEGLEVAVLEETLASDLRVKP